MEGQQPFLVNSHRSSCLPHPFVTPSHSRHDFRAHSHSFMRNTHLWRRLTFHIHSAQPAPSVTPTTRRTHSTLSAMQHDSISPPPSTSTPNAPAASSSSLDAIRAEKAQLRQRMKGHLAALTPDQISAESQHTTRLLLRHPALSRSLSSTQCVAVYVSQPTSEFQTRHLLSHLFASGKRVFLPRVVSRDRMLMLECHSLSELDSLPANLWGIREPDSTEGRCELMDCVEQVGLCVVPGVAFTRDGLRLGHGRGYYDRYLHGWDEQRQKRGIPGRVTTVALALRCQLVEQLPVMEHDRRIDHVIHAPMDSEVNT